MGSLDGIARRVGSVAAAAKLAGRTVVGVDDNPIPRDWRHVTKVDPEGRKRLPLLYPLYLSHTDALSVGGSSGVTEVNTVETFRLLQWTPVPAIHEPSDADHITEYVRDQSRFVAIPEVLNGDSAALVGTLGAAIDRVERSLVPSLLDEHLPRFVGTSIREDLGAFLTCWLFDRAVFEAYVIQNPDSAAAREANVSADDVLDPAGAREHALAAERHLESEIVYVEYSGAFGAEEGETVLEAVDDGLSWSRIWYGGGVANREDAERMLAAGADAVVVGDAFHEVAEEEVDVWARAREELPADADHSAVLEWVDDTVDVADSAAAQYLSTIPDVGAPEARAREYLAATVHTALRLRALADELDELDESATPGAIRNVAGGGDAVPGTAPLEGVLDDDAERFAARVGSDLIADDPELPIHHLGLAETFPVESD